MAIEKNCFKVMRLESEMLSSRSRESMSSDEEDEFAKAVESDDDEEDDCDSGAGSDDFDLLELGETGEEFVQVGDQTCSVPIDLYDLQGLGDILSMDVWNECLTEEERFGLTKYLPDMDQETFMRTLKGLFTGCNMHFGSPINKLFEMFKGGLCEPRVALYRQGMNFFQNRMHYHRLRKHQNSMVVNLYQIKDAWANCRGYSIEEKLRVLNIMKSQKSLMHEKMEELETDSERDESVDGLWSRKTKDRKHRHSPAIDFSGGRQMALETATYGRQNPKGTLKVAGSKMSLSKDLAGHFMGDQHGVEMNSGPYGSSLVPPRLNKASGYDTGMAGRMRNQVRDMDDYGEEAMFEVAVQRDRNFPRTGPMDKAGPFNVSNKYEGFRANEYADSFIGLPVSLKGDFAAYGRNVAVNQLSDIEMLTAKQSNSMLPYDYVRKLKYPDNMHQVNVEDQVAYMKGHTSKLSGKGSQVELSDGNDPFWHGKVQGGPFRVDESSKYGDWNVKGQNWKLGRNSPDTNVNDKLFSYENRSKLSQRKERGIPMQNGRRDPGAVKGTRVFTKGEDTASDSSERSEENDDDNPLMRSKWAFPSGVSGVKSMPFPKNAKFVEKDKRSGGRSDMVEGDNYNTKGKQKGKLHDVNQSRNSKPKGLEDSFFPGLGRVNGDGVVEDAWGGRYKFGRKGQFQEEEGEKFALLSMKKTNPAFRRPKTESTHQYAVPQTSSLQDHVVNYQDDLVGRKLRDNGSLGRMRKKGQYFKTFEDNQGERSDLQLVECNSLARKRKVKDDTLIYMDEMEDNGYLHQQQFDDSTQSRKRGKRKIEDDTGTFERGTSELPATEVAEVSVEQEIKPVKKAFTPITPTVHSGFSFSIVHLLSAVRMAMITVLPDDSVNMKEDQDKKHEGSTEAHLHGNVDINNTEQSGRVNVPSLTIQDIVSRLRSNPGDPCILETQEPLQDLVRGVLKIFSSKTAPLGAKGWKAIVVYEKSKKSWSWVGPVPQNPSDQEVIEEVTSPEAWGLPHKMLVKLVDSFANWLKSGQETLQQIGSLPAPPLSMMQLNLDEKERFKDLRAQKSLNTFTPSSDEVRSYFRREEVLRYLIPDRAFSYTAIDGKKSIVAPLRRCGGKPTSKARDHFMLKRDRPPHVTILCLVRDAAARLPGSIGTRADVCTLIRDSQYIVEDVSDAQVNQVVSGALDRLHYERDPCVQFDGERKLWVYLHREREEEDFEDDGTSSTKKWKRQKKEPVEPPEQGTVTVACNGIEEGDPTGIDLSSDLNVDPSCMDDDKKLVVSCYDDKPHVEENIEGLESEKMVMHAGPSMVWESFGLNPDQENGLLCQENSANEDFIDQAFVKEEPADLLGTSLT